MGKIALVKDPSHFFKNINGATLIHANALINLWETKGKMSTNTYISRDDADQGSKIYRGNRPASREIN